MHLKEYAICRQSLQFVEQAFVVNRGKMESMQVEGAEVVKRHECLGSSRKVILRILLYELFHNRHQELVSISTNTII